jgi:hypothetical protein
MKNFLKKLFKRTTNSGSVTENTKSKNISDTTNDVFGRYQKSFKDLARYDREGKISAN